MQKVQLIKKKGEKNFQIWKSGNGISWTNLQN